MYAIENRSFRLNDSLLNEHMYFNFLLSLDHSIKQTKRDSTSSYAFAKKRNEKKCASLRCHVKICFKKEHFASTSVVQYCEILYVSTEQNPMECKELHNYIQVNLVRDVVVFGVALCVRAHDSITWNFFNMQFLSHNISILFMN